MPARSPVPRSAAKPDLKACRVLAAVTEGPVKKPARATIRPRTSRTRRPCLMKRRMVSKAAAAAFDTILRFIKQGLRVLLVLGLIVALAGFFTGPSVTAARTRQAFKSGFAALRGTGERAA